MESQTQNTTDWKQLLETFRTNAMRYLSPLTDKQYQAVKAKTQTNKYEKSFIQVYENVYLMYGLSLLIAIPGIFYMRKFINYRKQLARREPGFTQGYAQQLKNKMFAFLSFGVATVINAEFYSYRHDLYGLIEDVRGLQK